MRLSIGKYRLSQLLAHGGLQISTEAPA
jgi:hypothetical protein